MNVFYIYAENTQFQGNPFSGGVNTVGGWEKFAIFD